MSKKINRKAVEWFLKSELPDLREKGVVPEESLAALERYYVGIEAQPGNTGKVVSVILYCIGALFVKLGFCLVIAHNWNKFPDWVRLSLGFIPLIGGAVFSGYALWKEKGASWREPAAIVYGIGIAAALAVTTQTYYLGGELRSFMLAWLCLLIPVPFILNSFGIVILSLAVAVFWNCCDAGSTSQLWLHVILPLLPGVALVRTMFRNEDTLIGVWSRYLLAPYAFLYCVPFFSAFHGGEMSMSLWLAVASALCVFGSTINADHPFNFFRNPIPAVGFIGGYFVLMGCSVPHLRYSSWTPVAAADLPYFAALIVPVAGVLFYTLKKPRNWLYLLSLLPAGVLLVFSISNDMYDIRGIAMSCVTLILMTVQFILSVKRNSLTSLNAAMLLILGLIFVWFMDSHISILTRGILFIAIGLIFVGVNILVLKHRKKGGPSHA